MPGGPVAIIGAGVSGLACARSLVEAGLSEGLAATAELFGRSGGGERSRLVGGQSAG